MFSYSQAEAEVVGPKLDALLILSQDVIFGRTAQKITIGLNQGDQISLRKNGPKCSPNHLIGKATALGRFSPFSPLFPLGSYFENSPVA
jgi:hypothetical protein